MTDSEKEAGLKVIQNYIDGTYQGNVKLLRDCLHKNTVMNGYLEDQLLLGGPELFFENIENNPSMAEGDTPYKGEITSIDVVGAMWQAPLSKRWGLGVLWHLPTPSILSKKRDNGRLSVGHSQQNNFSKDRLTHIQLHHTPRENVRIEKESLGVIGTTRRQATSTSGYSNPGGGTNSPTIPLINLANLNVVKSSR